MPQYQGTAKVHINGREYPTLKGATFETGGVQRNPVIGQAVYGWQGEPKAPRLSCQMPNGSDLSIDDINNMTDVTVTFVADVGKTWMMANAWSEGNAQFTDSGSISVSFAAVESKEI